MILVEVVVADEIQIDIGYFETGCGGCEATDGTDIMPALTPTAACQLGLALQHASATAGQLSAARVEARARTLVRGRGKRAK